MTPKNSETDRSNQLEPRREERVAADSRDRDDAVPELSPECLEHGPPELGQLVEQEYAAMRESAGMSLEDGRARRYV